MTRRSSPLTSCCHDDGAKDVLREIRQERYTITDRKCRKRGCQNQSHEGAAHCTAAFHAFMSDCVLMVVKKRRQGLVDGEMNSRAEEESDKWLFGTLLN
ncbi:hypothetical protein M758_6G085600 [Ceratodon purpureus]|nr:hypothetical protein M758_6G085600 [Ceratodon purpureus]